MSDVTVREGRPLDVETIVSFNAAIAVETEGHALDWELLHRGVEAALRRPALGNYYVAERAGRIVGQLLVTYEWSDWRCGTFWWLQSVYVDPDHRGQGVFSALYRYVASIAERRQDVVGLRLYVEHGNEAAKQVYQKLGMRPTGYEVYEAQFTEDGDEDRRGEVAG